MQNLATLNAPHQRNERLTKNAKVQINVYFNDKLFNKNVAKTGLEWRQKLEKDK